MSGESRPETLSEVVREAVDAHVATATTEIEILLDETFGSMPDLEVPARSDWHRGHG